MIHYTKHCNEHRCPSVLQEAAGVKIEGLQRDKRIKMSISQDIDHVVSAAVVRVSGEHSCSPSAFVPRECASRSEDYVLARPASLQTSRATRRNFVVATAQDGHSGSPLPPPPPEPAASRRTGCSSYRHKFDKSLGNRPASSIATRPRAYLTGEKGEGRVL